MEQVFHLYSRNRQCRQMTIQGQRVSSEIVVVYCPKNISIDQCYLGRILRYEYCLLKAPAVWKYGGKEGQFENMVEKNYNSVTTVFSGSYDWYLCVIWSVWELNRVFVFNLFSLFTEVCCLGVAMQCWHCCTPSSGSIPLCLCYQLACWTLAAPPPRSSLGSWHPACHSCWNCPSKRSVRILLKCFKLTVQFAV